MKFRIMDGNTSIAEVDVPDGDFSRLISIERADDPTLLFVGVDLHEDGTVKVGHWPDGEEWVSVLEAPGVQVTA